jgi:ferredoxin-nitrite reductase
MSIEQSPMSTNSLPEALATQPLEPHQRTYLEGFFAGVKERAVVFGDLFPGGVPGQTSAPSADDTELTTEERIKREEHPLDSYYRIADNARANATPEKEEVFRFKWHGLFYLSPVKDSFMARLRIPGGRLTSAQMRDLAAAARDLTSGYVQVTTRANFQMRLIQPKDTVAFLRRVRATGLHTQGAGADNVRNITCNPTAGVDPQELIDCTPYVKDLADHILNQREFSNLPRKFNIAFDGGGLIGSVEDTNDIGIKAVRVGPDVRFRIAVGGATGHQAFANDLGIRVPPEEVVEVVLALLRVYLEKGDRTNRKRARLKHLLESMPLADYLAAAETRLGRTLDRAPLAPGELSYGHERLAHSHIGPYPQKQSGFHFLGIALPAGQITPKQMERLADLADNYGSGDLRLTVWQNIVIPDIPEAYLAMVQKAVVKAGLSWKQSHVSSGIVACTGNRYCKYAATDTKGHALELARHLEKRVPLDRPVNIHLTGCPHSCAQHYMGDIGLLGAKTRAGEEAYTVFVGGGFGSHRACGRLLFQAMPFEELKPALERLLLAYLDRRNADEPFQEFAIRHEIRQLQEMVE